MIKKIAILNKYQNRVNRGVETYILELTKRLSNKFKIDIINDINYFKILVSDYDLIMPTNGRSQVFIIRMITWLKRIKMVVAGFSGIGFDDRLNLYAFPDFFIPMSTKALKKSKRINPFVKLIKIPGGVDLSKFKKFSKVRKSSTKVILSVGAFTAQKRHDLVIKAVSKLNNVNLIIAGGGGDLKESIEALGKEMLGERFEIIQTTNDKMPGIYNQADVFTLASNPTESFGIVLVEAMATGLPVVATNDAIRKEIVGDAGLFVDPTNADEYAKILEKALNTNWGDKPRNQAEKFSWDKIAKSYEEILENL